MRRYRDLPIRQKLTWVSVLTSAVTLLFACIAFVAYERVTFRETALHKLASQASIVAYNTSSAVMFDDPNAASTTLAALKAEPSVVAAALDGTNGGRFGT
jgi:hypothetical protein